jgi:hypothetical protein
MTAIFVTMLRDDPVQRVHLAAGRAMIVLDYNRAWPRSTPDFKGSLARQSRARARWHLRMAY